MVNVLIVDDDHLVRKGFIAMMPWEKYGLKVIGEAGNGRKALEFMENERVDLLITDLAMPVMSGIDLMREVRARQPDIDMVVLTFHQDFEYIQDALRLGALDYITKVELEDEQLDDVLKRISGRIREKQAQTDSPPHSSAQGGLMNDPLPGDMTSEQPYSPEVRACIRKAVDMIARELQEELHLPDIAKRVNMSRSYFSRCFRDIAGQTFNDYVRELRIEHAKRLLKQTANKISWIAAQSGYPNEKYFCRVFRECTGMLPSEYRKRESVSRR